MALEPITRQEKIIAGQDLTPITRTEMFLKQYGGGGSGGGSGSGVQPDWNQNDETQPDYVKNRPFYTGNTVETVLVEESTVAFEDFGGVYGAGFPSTFEATVGETYKVSWDGTVYECTCVDYDGPAIGNLSIENDYPDTGEPFLIMIYKGDGIDIVTADTSASHTFSIIGNQAQIVKIPAKYIDKDASGYIVVHRNATMTEQEAENYHAAILSREVVFIIWKDIYINYIQFDAATNKILLTTQNNETYTIAKNVDGLFDLSDRKLYNLKFPSELAFEDEAAKIDVTQNKIIISSGIISSGVGSTDVLFQVEPDGTESKAFEVLGNGEAVTPALILYSSTADSTKKFKITVDDSGTISATEVTE